MSIALSDSWSRYWRAGTLHSCGCAFRDNYEGEVAAFWRERFRALPARARIVDVGTGNGAVPLLAKSVSDAEGRGFEIHGVDLAAIDPPASRPADAARFDGIRFHPGTSALSLPFADGSVDALTGHYAFEYFPRTPAVAEAARVVRTAGMLALVAHHRDSVVLQATAEQLGHCALLFDGVRFFEAVRGLVGHLAAAPTPQARAALQTDRNAVAARDRLNAAAQALSERIATARTPDILQVALGAAGEVLRRAAQVGEAASGEAIARAERDLRDEHERLRDLDAAALDHDGVQRLRAQLEAVGFADAAIDTLSHQRERLLGWTLLARRG